MSRSSQPLTIGDTTVEPGERRQFRFQALRTFHGDAIELPVTVINGIAPGPTVFLTAAIHGDELNGIKIVQEVARTYQPTEIHGAIVCLHVVNVPGFIAQQRYLPIDGEDLNRAFPGSSSGTSAKRLANQVYTAFIQHCDLGIDFHTSTRGRTTMYHVRADMDDPDVARVAQAVGTNVILDGTGTPGTLRRAASEDGIPTVTIEMGKAHRFEVAHITRGRDCIASVLAEYDVLPERPVRWPGWRRIVAPGSEKTWLRADTGGLVTPRWGPDPLVDEGEELFRISDHFSTFRERVRAPFPGLIIGALESAIAYPGHPLCHIVRLDDVTRRRIEEDIDAGVFETYRPGGFRAGYENG